MLGFEGIGVFLAYVLSIAAAAVCVVYGARNWNKPGDEEVAREVDEEMAYEERDPDTEEEK